MLDADDSDQTIHNNGQGRTTILYSQEQVQGHQQPKDSVNKHGQTQLLHLLGVDIYWVPALCVTCLAACDRDFGCVGNDAGAA